MKADDLIHQSWEALEAEDYDRAESLARKALRSDPDSAEARLLIGQVLLAKEDFLAAIRHLREATGLAPDDAGLRVDLGRALFGNGEFREAEVEVRKALAGDPSLPEAHYSLALLVERDGDFEEADRAFRRAHELDPEHFPLPSRITRDECLKAIEQAIEQLPEEFQGPLENVSIEVQDLPEERLLQRSQPPLDPGLLGLFDGVPLGDRSLFDLPRLPDRILIFQRNLERQCGDRDELIEEIRVTLLHEIGHYLGYDDDDLEDRGYG